MGTNNAVMVAPTRQGSRASVMIPTSTTANLMFTFMNIDVDRKTSHETSSAPFLDGYFNE